jgi:beta-N-acetylhexosaminidase
MRNALYRFLALIALASLLIPSGIGQAAFVRALDSQGIAPEDSARALLEQLSPEERVGQLFIVSFIGPDASPSTPIYDLIVNYHIGGVMMLAANDNFLAPDVTAAEAQNLLRQLQLNEYNASQQTDPTSATDQTDAYIPLFIATIQDGDGYPADQILYGLTTLPNLMTIGATWDPGQAQQIGAVLGNELSALGFNLLIGPSLDVLDTPRPGSSGDMGVRAFGGDPYWVGQMGSAYIRGIHQGSQGKMAVVAKNFPGFGGSDRPPEEEVPTVRKPLEQLKLIELAPFFAVTGNAPDVESTTDALLVSHIRYQGFQDNIRDTTKPVSFDAEALTQITALQPISDWRATGGVLISADLGSRAVRRFYDPSGQTFNSPLVARDAFLAGNDILYLGNFTASGDPDSYASIVRTLDFFTEKYRTDEAFAQRVDDSVLRILTLKYRLYGERFSIANVLRDQTDLARLNASNQYILDTASNSAALISPSQAELADTLPSPPGRDERIVFVTDTRTYFQCSRCPEQFIMPTNALETAVFRLYNRGGQVLANNLKSYSFQDLQDMLDAGTGVAQIENDLKSADWIVFSMLDVTPSEPASNALRYFLDQRPDLFRQKKLIVFAFTAPYYLDATDVSKLTAYYAMFSHGPNKSSLFVDMAARLLFQEMRASGVLPVSVPGIGYDLNQVVFPAAEQTIAVMLDLPEIVGGDPTPTPEATPLPSTFQPGDVVAIRTGLIVDNNGKPVPDGTIVRFTFTRLGDSPIIQQSEALTVQGVARVTYRVENPGKWEVRAESGDARQSDVLPFEVPAPAGTITVAPTATNTPPPPTLTVTPDPSATAVPPTVTPSPTPTPIVEPVVVQAGFSDWLMAVLVSLGVAISGYILVNRLGGVRWAVRLALLALSGGLLAYTYLAVDLPGSAILLEETNVWGVILLTLVGALLGSAVTGGWRLILRGRANGTKSPTG